MSTSIQASGLPDVGAWEGIATGLATAFNPANLVWVVAGCLAGTFIGMMPGLGPITAIALMIPVSYSLDPAAGLIMMAGVYYGAVFGGSTSSILINAPGVASTVATSFDGYPMARRGQAGRALALAAHASFAGGTVGAVALLVFAPTLAALAKEFQSPEYALMLVFALSSIAAFADRGQVLRSLAAALVGLMLGTVGTDQSAGVQRFTFGRLDLTDGLSFVLVAMATFALAEAFRMVLAGDAESPTRVSIRATPRRSRPRWRAVRYWASLSAYSPEQERRWRASSRTSSKSASAFGTASTTPVASLPPKRRTMRPVRVRSFPC